MPEQVAIAAKAVCIGIGGTVALDLWAASLERIFKVPATNWGLVGRWVGHMKAGRFRHDAIGKAPPIHCERAVGWTVHYAIGILYGLALVAIGGAEWLAAPTLTPPLVLSWALLLAPYFVMMPGMGMGIAGAKTPSPNVTRLKSAASHSIFGLGMYATALILNSVLAGSG